MKIPEKLINELHTALDVSDALHLPLTTDMQASGVITEEYYEVIEAMRSGNEERVRAELIDLANACIRRVVSMDGAA